MLVIILKFLVIIGIVEVASTSFYLKIHQLLGIQIKFQNINVINILKTIFGRATIKLIRK
jgi:hypothetical protein